ncbi:hypothetical protein [Kozakia baliensis]|uniref:Uncharacterized protein n=1 Tax=Kozakia baliensis TaxID=153496 RepID=A0A1D8UVP0_9PROT|nr:hypothetical protein [Kozakia baliensis]AOX17724.1 hypothetical protein A0U89_11885 [Kozakia baliensis]GBR31662.1 hypothetical protein AA0488_2346 [Kozakia baliensis NRIC 0488]GEL62760.1 hypothetical protein KBA01_00460 [Kozakia baliensis]
MSARITKTTDKFAEMRPTPERLRRDNFQNEGDALRVVSTVQALYDAQDIGDDEKAAAERWRREHLFATLGVVDGPVRVGVTDEKGDVHTWMLSRGKCAERLSRLKDTLGLGAQVRLEMMLAREMSFSAMARLLYPSLSEARARMKVSAQCSFLLEQLVNFYRKKKI